MGLAEARAERDRLRALVRGGGNPANVARVERAAKVERAETTFGAIATEFLNKRAKEGLSPGSVKRERRLIEKDMAAIGMLPITDVTAPLLLGALRKLEKRGVVETAHRARSFAGRVFRYAIATGRAQSNPANDLVGALEQPQVKHLATVTDPDKIRDLLRSMYSYSGSPVTQAALKLAPMLFVRPGELGRPVGLTSTCLEPNGASPRARQGLHILSHSQHRPRRSSRIFSRSLGEASLSFRE